MIVVFLATVAITSGVQRLVAGPHGRRPRSSSLPPSPCSRRSRSRGSVLLSSNANGIAVFMLFGAGLTAGLLGQIGEALGSRTLDRVADIVSWALPFEALYQAALSAITADTVGFTRLAINLGPFGGAEEAGPLLWPWTLLYLALVGVGAAAAFARRDL